MLYARLAPELPLIAEQYYVELASPKDARSGLIEAMTRWLEAALGGGDRLATTRAATVQQHVSLGLPSLLGTMNLIRGECADRIMVLFPAGEAWLIAKATDKLLDCELAALAEAAVAERLRSAASDRLSSLQTLSAGLAHELRNPVNSARLKLQLIERRLRRNRERDPNVAEAIGAIHQELERLVCLLQEFLAFARPAELTVGERDVAELIRALLSSEAPIANARGVALAPFEADEILAELDGGKLLQVLRHLVRNAIEACTEGGTVAVSARADDERVQVVIEDDGVGLPPTVRQRMFDPFFTTKDSGTGLGLAVVHSLLKQHGGTIDVLSNNRGARFEVTLPRRPSLA
jgi:signal transduction histidine kinase